MPRADQMRSGCSSGILGLAPGFVDSQNEIQGFIVGEKGYSLLLLPEGSQRSYFPLQRRRASAAREILPPFGRSG